MRSKSRPKTRMTKPTELRSRIMRAIKSKDTKPEKTVESWLGSARFKTIRHAEEFPGKPDFVLSRHGVAVFVHGCFWHGHGCGRGSRMPKTNRDYWRRKLANNKRRDARNASALRRLGWHVVTLWECNIEDGRARKRLLNFTRKSGVPNLRR